jgi:hypothetical protein
LVTISRRRIVSFTRHVRLNRERWSINERAVRLD